VIFELLAAARPVGTAKKIATDVEREAAAQYVQFLVESRDYEQECRDVVAETVRLLRTANGSPAPGLRELHDRSIRIVDRAKGTLDYARRTLDVLHANLRTVHYTADDLDRRHLGRRDQKDWNGVEAIREEQTSLKDLKVGLHEQIGVVTRKKNDFLDHLRTFNALTKDLKRKLGEPVPAAPSPRDGTEARSAAERAAR